MGGLTPAGAGVGAAGVSAGGAGLGGAAAPAAGPAPLPVCTTGEAVAGEESAGGESVAGADVGPAAALTDDGGVGLAVASLPQAVKARNSKAAASSSARVIPGQVRPPIRAPPPRLVRLRRKVKPLNRFIEQHLFR